MKKKSKIILIILVSLLMLATGLITSFAIYYGSLHNLRAAVIDKLFGTAPVSMLNEAYGVPVLMYHHIVPAGTYDGTENKDNAAVISAEKFSEQMEYLHNEGYNTIFMSELVQMLREKKVLPQKTVVISFDDGYESVYVYAVPVLEQYGFKADMAIIGKTFDHAAGEAFVPEKLSTLSREQIRKMYKSGLWEFASHTYNLHQELPVNAKGIKGYASTSEIYLFREKRKESSLEKTSRILRDFETQNKLFMDMDIPVNIIVYPYGAVDRNLIKASTANGMQAGFTVRTGLVKDSCDLFRLPRLTVSDRDTMKSFIRKLRIGK